MPFSAGPDWPRLPLVILATLATVIARQAVIAGAFSVTQQAVQLGFLPRLRIQHTSAQAMGQIYVSLVNWALLILVIMVVIGGSSNLAAAYGIAVTGTMFITSCMLGVLTFAVWKWPVGWAGLVTGGFLAIDGLYFASNLTKIPDGGWFPLVVAAIIFACLTTWAMGRRLIKMQMSEGSMPFERFIRSSARNIPRVHGTAVFLSSTQQETPPRSSTTSSTTRCCMSGLFWRPCPSSRSPHVPIEQRLEQTSIDESSHQVVLHYGFMDEIDVPETLRCCGTWDPPLNTMQTSFFLGRQTLIASSRPGMAIWREKLFALMVRSAESAMDFFKLPPNRVVELGSQVEI